MNRELDLQDEAYARYHFNPTENNKVLCEIADHNLRLAQERWVKKECDRRLWRYVWQDRINNFFRGIFKWVK